MKSNEIGLNKNKFEGKKILVAGGTGMIGIPLVKMLIENKKAVVRIADIKNKERAHKNAEFIQADLTKMDDCLKVCSGVDYVFNLAGIKGSPKKAQIKPADFFTPMVLMNINMLEAARICKVEAYLYTSSVGVYAPAEIFYEEDVWNEKSCFPSRNDWFGGWAKRIGELQIEAYRRQYNWQKLYIVRVANCFGPFDSFNSEDAMVIPALIKRAVDGEDPLVVWGDGSPIRDFIYSDDAASAMITIFEEDCRWPCNIGSGVGISIKSIVDIIVNNLDKKPEIIWDTSKPIGDAKRLMDVERMHLAKVWPSKPLEIRIKETMDWYKRTK